MTMFRLLVAAVAVASVVAEDPSKIGEVEAESVAAKPGAAPVQEQQQQQGEVQPEVSAGPEVAEPAVDAETEAKMQATFLNQTAKAKADIEAIVAAASIGGSGASLRGAVAAGWGHGVFGETCCMCARRAGFTTYLYAAGDYDHMYGGHTAMWYCNSVCETQCHFKGGHKFGCYDEQHMIHMDMQYGHNPSFTILHQGHFGNIC